VNETPSTSDHQHFAEWDAAYVLGSLTPADRRAYETHLEQCPRCRAGVADLAQLPGLLAAAGAMGAVAGAPMVEDGAASPPDLVDLVVARAHRRRRTVRRRILIALTSAAAVVVLAVGIPLGISGMTRPAESVVLATRVDDAPVAATVGFTPAAWGTRLSVECVYADEDAFPGEGPWEYALVVTGDDGLATQVSTWGAVPDRTIRLEAATALPLERIASVEVRAIPRDEVLLEATVRG
jgi:hypothetical protein